jgi:hypothetical protein
MKPWLMEQSTILSHIWYRPSGTMLEKTQHKTGMERLEDFNNSNSMLKKERLT